MKKLFKSALMAMLAFVTACHTEKEIPEAEPSIEINVIADGNIKPSSKTVIVDDDPYPYVKWLSTDKLRVYEVRDGEINANAETKSIVLSDGDRTASFTANLTGGTSGTASYKYVAVYPPAAVDKSGSFYRITMPSEQVLNGNNFAPNSDILISEVLDHGTSRVSNSENLSFRFRRVGTVIKLRLKGISAGETIKKIVFTAPVNIAGRIKYTPADGLLDPGSIYYDGTTTSRSVILRTDFTATGDDVFWFRVLCDRDWEKDSQIGIEVETDQANYYRNGRDEYYDSITLPNKYPVTDGGLTGVGINLEAYRVEKPAPVRYLKVDGGAGVVADGGEYIFVSARTGGALCGMSAYSGKVYTAGADVYEDGEAGAKYIDITSEPVTTLSLEDAGGGLFYIKDSDGLYLYSTETSAVYRGEKADEAKFKWTVTGSTIANSVNIGGKVNKLQYNASSPRFACYTSDQATVYLYMREGTNKPLGISFATDSYSFRIGTGDLAAFAGQTVSKASGSDSRTVTYSMSGENIGTINPSTGEVSLNNITYGTATVTASVPSDATYRAGSVSYTIVVTPNSAVPGGWLEIPGWSAASIAGTAGAYSMGDLYEVTHRAQMGGRSQRNFTLLYNPSTFASFWVAYPLTGDHLGAGREESWEFDPVVPSAKQTNLRKRAYGVDVDSDYYPSNQYYARGHQIPNADRNGVDAMMAQTYYMTNLTPQLQNGFNGGIWSKLEAGVRNLVSGSHSADTVYVVTGAAFRKVGGSEDIVTITNSNDSKLVPVPNYYWKALLKVKWTGSAVSSASAIGFWLEHADSYSSGSAAFVPYAVSVDQIEAWTGLDLFKNLSVELQTTAEANTSWTIFGNF